MLGKSHDLLLREGTSDRGVESCSLVMTTNVLMIFLSLPLSPVPVVKRTCDSETTMNNTYFTEPVSDNSAQSCTLNVNRINSNICQLRCVGGVARE